MVFWPTFGELFVNCKIEHLTYLTKSRLNNLSNLINFVNFVELLERCQLFYKLTTA